MSIEKPEGRYQLLVGISELLHVSRWCVRRLTGSAFWSSYLGDRASVGLVVVLETEERQHGRPGVRVVGPHAAVSPMFFTPGPT